MGADHHGIPEQTPDPELKALMQRFTDQVENRAKREYPQGRMGAKDDGALAMAITADKKHGTVVVDFGKPVEWVAFSPADVAKIVKVLIAKAREVAAEPFIVEI